MNPDEIILSPSAERELRKLPRQDQKMIANALREFRDGKSLTVIEKLKGHPKFYRMKAGSRYRIIFHPINPQRLVVLVIRDRKDAYRGLNNLDNKLEAALLQIDEEVRQAIGSAG